MVAELVFLDGLFGLPAVQSDTFSLGQILDLTGGRVKDKAY